MDEMSDSAYDEIDEVISYLDEAPIRLAVFGEFSAGKTTVLNALIGEEILSVAVDPTTAVPTRIRYGREFNIFVDREDDKRLHLFEDDPPFWTRFVGRRDVLSTLQKQQSTIQDFLWKWTKEGERADEVTRVVIELPLDWLKGGLELVDTPGVNNEFVRHQGFTEQEAGEADIAVLLMDARQGGGKRTEFEFMNDVQKQVERCVVASNKMDLIPAGEREEFLSYIRENALPNHWEGAVTPPVMGISALAALHPDDHDEPDLVAAFEDLRERLETMAEKERGKLLLARKGNPEKQLFSRAKKLEGDAKYDRAHRLYFDLLDILEAAELDATPAEEGIARCEENLTAQVDALDTLNERYNEAMAIGENDPDGALERLLVIRDEKEDLRLEDGDLQASIEQLQDRIEKRDAARNRIRKAKTIVKQHRKNENWIEAAEKAEESLQWIDTAELPKVEEAELRAFVETQIQDREDWKERRERDVEEALDRAGEYPEEALKRLRKVHNERKCLDGSGIDLEEKIALLEARIRRRDKARVEIEELRELAKAHQKKEEWIEAADAATKIRTLIGAAELSEKEKEELRQFILQRVQDRDEWAERRWKEVKAEIDSCVKNDRFLAARNLLEELNGVASYTPFEEETEELVDYVKEQDRAQQAYLEAVQDALSAAEVLRQDRVEPEKGKAVQSAVEKVREAYSSFYGVPDLPDRVPITDSTIVLNIEQKLGIAQQLKVLAEPAPDNEEVAALVRELRAQRREIQPMAEVGEQEALALVIDYPDHPKAEQALHDLHNARPPFWALQSGPRRTPLAVKQYRDYLGQKLSKESQKELEGLKEPDRQAGFFEWQNKTIVSAGISATGVSSLLLSYLSFNSPKGILIGGVLFAFGICIQYYTPNRSRYNKVINKIVIDRRRCSKNNNTISHKGDDGKNNKKWTCPKCGEINRSVRKYDIVSCSRCMNKFKY